MDWHLKARIFACLHLAHFRSIFFICMLYYAYMAYLVSSNNPTRAATKRRYSMIARIPDQIKHMRKITEICDVDCVNNLRMDRNAFGRLCYLLENVGGLTEQRHMRISEQVAIFLSVLSHHTKNRIVGFNFERSGDTISRYFNKCLDALIKCHTLLYAKPQPIGDDCDNENWKCFKGSLGALDGTLIRIQVPKKDQNRYRSRKGKTHVNVLAVCNPDMQFIYVLSGWEGSAADSRVLRDSVTRPTGLRVPTGNYYLCDCHYVNAEGFLTPYHGRRYHLQEWGEGVLAPQDPQEYFNLKHSKARNIIERAFKRLKGRWVILRSKAFYPVKTHNKIVICCCLLHNFIRNEMSVDPMDLVSDEDYDSDDADGIETDAWIDEPKDVIGSVQGSSAWNEMRDALAQEMFNSWSGTRYVNSGT